MNLINAFLHAKGMDEINLRKEFLWFIGPEETVGSYHEKYLKMEKEDTESVISEPMSFISESSSESSDEKEPEELKEEIKEPIKTEELELKKVNKPNNRLNKQKYNEEQTLAKYAKWTKNEKPIKKESKSFSFLITDEARKQKERLSKEAQEFLSNFCNELKAKLPELVKGKNVGATAGNFEKLQGLSDMWEFRMTDPKLCAELVLPEQTRILFSIGDDKVRILYVGEHPTNNGYKMISNYNQSFKKTN